MTLGEKIALKRIKANMTQKQLGERIGLSSDRICQYENGVRTPKSDLLQDIAEALETDVDYFFDTSFLSSKTKTFYLLEEMKSLNIDITALTDTNISERSDDEVKLNGVLLLMKPEEKEILSQIANRLIKMSEKEQRFLLGIANLIVEDVEKGEL